MTDAHEGAKMTARALGLAVNMDMAQITPVGIEARAYNFAHGDLPVMLHHAGYPLERPTDHQKTLLDMPAADFRRQAERNYQAAAQVLGWTAPQNDFAVKDFMGHGSFDRSTVGKLLDHYEMVHDQHISPSQNRRNNAIILNDEHQPIEPDLFEDVAQRLRDEGSFLSGMEVRLKNDPQGAVVREIEATILQSEGPNMYTTHHKVSGLTRKIGQNELLDGRGLEHFYGVIAEDEKGQHYMVRIEQNNPNPHVLTSNVREVSGIAGAYIQQHAKNIEDELAMTDVPVSGSSKTMRATCGEFVVRNLRGYDDGKGPCVVIASPWQSSPDKREMDIAFHEIQAYKARFEQEPDTSVRLVSRMEENRLDTHNLQPPQRMNTAAAAAALAAGASR